MKPACGIDDEDGAIEGRPPSSLGGDALLDCGVELFVSIGKFEVAVAQFEMNAYPCEHLFGEDRFRDVVGSAELEIADFIRGFAQRGHEKMGPSSASTTF